MAILVFEDEAVDRLYPITIGRPAYAITCGSYRLIDWLRRLELPLLAAVRPHLAAIQKTDFGDLNSRPARPGEPLLAVNARLAPSVGLWRRLSEWWASAQPGAVTTDGVLAAALFPPGTTPPADASCDGVARWLHSDAAPRLPRTELALPLLHYPHDVVRVNMEVFAANIEHRLAQGSFTHTAEGVFLGEGATLGEYVVCDTRPGPVVLDRGAQVGPHSFLRGPIYLGPGCRVNEHSAIKDAVSLGAITKVGGEVEASVVESYTNKQHHGFLGHSYLGSWINLGAGTCNSDLKNTYGAVKMDYRGESVATGMQFFGCVLGDYAKTAINTGIFTGKTIGACSMVYGFVTTNVPSFVNYARLFGQVTELPPEVMIATQQRMFARRRVEQRPCDIQLIRDMYELTGRERQLTGEPLSL